MHPKYYKGKHMKELIDPKRTRLHHKTLQNKMAGAKHGQMSEFLKGAYGCGACVLKENCPDFPNSKGICLTRSRMYALYLKAGSGEILPIMVDQLAKHLMEKDIEHKKGIKQGKMTEDFFRHAHLCVSLSEKIQRAQEGSKIKIEHTYKWIDELRDAINVTGKVKDDNNSGESRTEEDLQGEVPEGSGAAESD